MGAGTTVSQPPRYTRHRSWAAICILFTRHLSTSGFGQWQDKQETRSEDIMHRIPTLSTQNTASIITNNSCRSLVKTSLVQLLVTINNAVYFVLNLSTVYTVWSAVHSNHGIHCTELATGPEKTLLKCNGNEVELQLDVNISWHDIW